MRYSYKVAGKTVELDQDEDLVAVRFKEPAPRSLRADTAGRAGLGPFAERYEVPKEHYTIRPVAPAAEARTTRAARAMRHLSSAPDVARATPVFKLGTARVFAADRVLVGFKEDPGDSPAQVSALNGRVVEREGNDFLVQLPEDSDTLEVAAELAKDPAVDYAEPDFITVGMHIARRPASTAEPSSLDPLAPNQYAIEITRAVDAWSLQRGNPDIRIAILDEGVDTGHEDLRDAILASFDGTDRDEFQEPKPWDAHGTACAGLSGAVHNDVGVKGIGGGCSLMAVRIAFSEEPGGRWKTSSSWIRRAIDWAWRNSADILSNSWGGGAPSNAIIKAFERARAKGRGGKGCIIIAAAGNDFGAVIFPASEPNILAVSASNEFDEFKTPTSRDGEGWWGSCFGPEVDVAAPGVHNWTTDISGTHGYGDTDYIPDFNGTSSATPIVAGCAGLVLSANPELGEAEVRQLIIDTADKVGQEPYVNGRNDQMGAGRVNVLRAVQAAQTTRRSLDGTVRQIAGSTARAGGFYLEQPAGDTYLLRAYHGYEAVASEVLEAQSMAYFANYLDKRVTVNFGRRQSSPYGDILWGARMAQLGGARVEQIRQKKTKTVPKRGSQGGARQHA